MARKIKINFKHTRTIREAFADFLLQKKALGLADKTIETYSHHFDIISKYLDSSAPIHLRSIKLTSFLHLQYISRTLSRYALKSSTTSFGYRGYAASGLLCHHDRFHVYDYCIQRRKPLALYRKSHVCQRLQCICFGARPLQQSG